MNAGAQLTTSGWNGTAPTPQAYIRPDTLYAWHGQSQLLTTTRGECGVAGVTTGYFFRETRHVSTLRLTVNGVAPWLCEASTVDPSTLHFGYVYPEIEESDDDGDEQAPTGSDGSEEQRLPHRALDIRVIHELGVAELRVRVTITNHARRDVTFELDWELDADFVDIQEAQWAGRQQHGPVTLDAEDGWLRFRYGHPELPYRTAIHAGGDGDPHVVGRGVSATLALAPQKSAVVALTVVPEDFRDPISAEGAAERERAWSRWRDRFTTVAIPGNAVAESIFRHNVRDLASFPLLQGEPDEWLAPQAGMPFYPALFGRDAVTVGWQAAFLDHGELLDASMTRLGRLQSDRVDDWHDEQPGRIPYQVRQGPLARLDINPYSAYYADYASPLMFIVSLAHLYSWTGDRECLRRHWDTARRILDWAREYGDMDGDGYLEYLTRSSGGTKNQGWKDSDEGIIYEDGTQVPAPLGTCELQGYWFAAQQLFAILSWVMGEREDARAYWDSATDLKERFNRDWWDEPGNCVGLAMDGDKRLVRACTTNAGHCLASGIVSDEHLPPLVGRLFAPDMFSGWGIRTLSSEHGSYNPLEYHLGSVWPVENATIVFGLRRFGFDTRAVELSRAMFELAALYPQYRIPETVGGHARGARPTPHAYPRSNTPQLWNASAFPLVVHSLLGLQPVAALDLLVVDPVLPTWLPEVTLRDLRIGGATATLRFWRDAESGSSHAEVMHQRGTLHLVKQPPPESLSAGIRDRMAAFMDGLWHR